MKTLIAASLLVLAAASATAQQYVQGHYRSDGTYVQGYYRSAPNSTQLDNYSTQGNTNPYTGQAGTVQPQLNQPSLQLQQPRTSQPSYLDQYRQRNR